MSRYTYRKFAAVLLGLFLLSACSSTTQGLIATPIPGLVNTLAVQTMTAQPELSYLFATPTPPAPPAPQPAPTQASEKNQETSPGSAPLEAAAPAPTPTSNYANDTFFSTFQPSTGPDGKETLCNAATFIQDVTIPDDSVLKPNVNFVKTWEIKNVGACTWTPDYQITLVWGDSLDGPSPSQLGKYVRPGETVQISIPMSAPSTGNCYQSNWLLQDPDGNQFGVGYKGRQFIYVAISVWDVGMPKIVH